MYSTQVYLYQQLTRVLLMDTSAGETFIYRYDPVYAKRLTINKGVDNVLLFEFVNQEQKPVNITGSTFMFRVINTENNALLLQKPMEVLNSTTGRVKVAFTGPELLEVLAQPASYSIQRMQPSGGYSDAVFVDAQAGASAPVDIVDSVLPEFVPSAELTIPTVELTSQMQYGGTSFSNYPDWAGVYWSGGASSAYYNSWLNTEYFSSYLEPQNAVTTIQMDLIGYTGTIKAQCAENYQSIWYNVTESTTYLNETRTIYMNVIGWHPLLRLAFNNSVLGTPDQPGVPATAYGFVADGVVQNIVVSNPGSGYLAPPKIEIIGNGSGAVAEAEIDQYGSVTAINVINGGSGYWPVPNNAVNPASNFPVPPQNQGVVIAITTGFVVNLMYR
jgi:hypothetical protein